VPPDSGLGVDEADPILHLYQVGVEQPVWEVRPQTKSRMAFIRNVFWLPNGDILVDGIEANYAVVAILDARNGSLKWEKRLNYYSMPSSTHAAFDAKRQRLLLRGYDKTYIEAYSWPQLQPVERYQSEETRNGCCIVDYLVNSPNGVLAMGWEAYGMRYHLIFWEGESTGRSVRLPYSLEDTSFLDLAWGPPDQVGFILVPATAQSSDVYTIHIVNARTGSVLWSITEEELDFGVLEWLPERGWMISTLWGGIRLYTGPQEYEVLRPESRDVPVGYLMDLSAVSPNRFLAVFDSWVEVWDWR
jgi:hypothetical protein